MRHNAIALGLALSLLGCSGPAPMPAPTRGAQVPLLTDELSGSASFVNVVMDVVADPETGTPIMELDGAPVRWPTGYTAWRVGSETEVLNPNRKRVLLTGQRYRLYPAPDLLGSEPEPRRYIPGPYRIIAWVEPCTPDLLGSTCVLGFHQQGDY